MTSSMRDSEAVRAIDPALLAEAAALGIDVPAACEAGLAQAIARVRDAAALAANREAIAAWNDWAGIAPAPHPRRA